MSGPGVRYCWRRRERLCRVSRASPPPPPGPAWCVWSVGRLVSVLPAWRCWGGGRAEMFWEWRVFLALPSCTFRCAVCLVFSCFFRFPFHPPVYPRFPLLTGRALERDTWDLAHAWGLEYKGAVDLGGPICGRMCFLD